MFIRASENINNMMQQNTNIIFNTFFESYIECLDHVPDDPDMAGAMFNTMLSGSVAKILAMKTNCLKMSACEIETYFEDFCKSTKAYLYNLKEQLDNDTSSTNTDSTI